MSEPGEAATCAKATKARLLSRPIGFAATPITVCGAIQNTEACKPGFRFQRPA